MRCGLLVSMCILALGLSGAVQAQRVQGGTAPGTSGVDPAAIAKALKQVDEQLTHPDPDMRIGYLEAIVAEGNARKIERAIRIAVSGQDEGLRALGMRAYFSATRNLPLDMVLNQAESKLVEDARADSRAKEQLPRHLYFIMNAAFKITLSFDQAPIGSVRGTLHINQDSNRKHEYAMRGERMTFGGYTVFGGGGFTCAWELHPSRDLKVIADVSCEGFTRRMTLEADMF